MLLLLLLITRYIVNQFIRNLIYLKDLIYIHIVDFLHFFFELQVLSSMAHWRRASQIFQATDGDVPYLVPLHHGNDSFGYESLRLLWLHHYSYIVSNFFHQ